MRPGMRLLDVGCGSGILSLAGVLFGCSRAVGIDVDRLAVWVARVNARLNQLSKQSTFAAGSLKWSRTGLTSWWPTFCWSQFCHAEATPHRHRARRYSRAVGHSQREVPQLQGGLLAHGWRITHQASQEEWTVFICEEA